MDGSKLEFKLPIAGLPIYNQEVANLSEGGENDSIHNLESYNSMDDEVSDYHNDDEYCDKILRQYFQLQRTGLRHNRSCRSCFSR